jgi:hypothetical protein
MPFFVVTEKGSCAANRLVAAPSTRKHIAGQWVSGKLVEAGVVRSLLAHCDKQGEVDANAPLPFRLYEQEIARGRLTPSLGAPWTEVRGHNDAKTRQMIIGRVQYQPKKARLSSELLTMPMAQQPA